MSNMFSHLSRGYGTWKGIAKLEKPESAIANGFPTEGLVLPTESLVLPPINKKRHLFKEARHESLYRVPPRDDIKLPDVIQSEPLPLPKTYSTKSGALLLYSEGCFVPGSRRLKKRPRLRKRKEKRLQTLQDLTSLVMEYKKNECDPLLLAHLWRKANYSGRDVRPGYSPQRYLSQLGTTTLDPDFWKKLTETGSLKNLVKLEDDDFLPLLLQDHEFGHKLLRQRPQPYTTMSLPPISPSSSMLGSYIFYKHGMSTGAASMVSMTSGSHDDQLSAKSVGSFVSLADRLLEVEPQSGFKRSYESLSSEEKEDLLTQLLVDVTLHNQGETSRISPENTTEFPSVETTVSDIVDTRSLKSLKSSSKSSVFSSVCSLPSIILTEVAQHTDSTLLEDLKYPHGKGMPSDILSSSSSVLGLPENDPTVGLDGINIEITDNTFDLEDTRAGSSQKDTNLSLPSEESSLEQLLVDALEVQDGETIHEFTDEIKSLKSLDYPYSDRSLNKSDSENTVDDLIDVTETGAHLKDLGHDGTTGGDGNSDHSEVILTTDGLFGVTVTDHDMDGHNTSFSDGGIGDGGIGGIGIGDGGVGDGGIGDGVVGDGGGDSGKGGVGGKADDGTIGCTISDGGTIGVDDISIRSGVSGADLNEETRNLTELDASESACHISLSNLQDEARLVVEQVLLRPQSGRLLLQDAQVASDLLMKRMAGLLSPGVVTDDIRVRSADPRKLRPLGRPRNSQINKKSQKTLSNKDERTVRSAGPTVASRTHGKQNEETTPPHQDEEKNQLELPELVASKEEETFPVTENGGLKEDNQNEIKLDDIVLSAGDVEESGTQSPEVALLDGELLTVKDLTTDQGRTERVKPTRNTSVKDKKENVKKGRKGKKGVDIKKGNVVKARRKKKSETQNEPPKTPPFRAGLVPEQKPPKGLDLIPSEAKANGSDMALPEGKVLAADEETKVEQAEKSGITSDLQTVGTDARVDLETGEVDQYEREETPLTYEKTPSLEIASSFEKTPSPPRSPREKTPSPRMETLSPREKTPSPRELASPQIVDEVGSPVREPSPELKVEISEKSRRTTARVAQRAAAAERRRLEVEKKRREREEARRKAQEEEARLEQLRLEAEEEMKTREEQRRIQKEKEECSRHRIEAEENERVRQERLIIERQRAARDEWKRKKEQMLAQRKLDEEMRAERERIDIELEEEQRREYEARIAHLEEEERERLMEERRLKEEKIKRQIEEERQRREEERRLVLEERRRMVEKMEALQERQLARQAFLESLLKEYQNLLLEQRTSRAFTFSYFDLLPWVKENWNNLDEILPESPNSLPTVCKDVENEEPAT